MAGKLKRAVVISCCLLLLCAAGYAQLRLPVYPDTAFTTYYQQRVTHFKTLPQTPNDIIFLGNSITDGAEWSELFGDSHIKNRGISGDMTTGVMARLNEVTNRKPAKVFLLIGVNDLSRNITPDSVVKNILFIAAYLHQQTPATQLYVQSILPVNSVYNKFQTHTNKAAQINTVNTLLQQLAKANNYTFINIHSAFCNQDGKMKPSLTNDGLHLKGEGYLLWKHLLYPYLFNLQPKASLLPLPRSLQWNAGFFTAYKCTTVIADAKLDNEQRYLQNLLAAKGIQITDHDSTGNKSYIELHIAKLKTPQPADETYHLQVTARSVVVTANTPHGIFNGIQSLMQLLRDNVIVDACDITDWPAFSWRGYMVDVGRNYQSVELLKQQIDQMARYKLNVFHFHLTEDIAWRLFIKKYPQLTAAQFMLRDKGMYYTVQDIQHLMAFCKERFITFIPEIDMPGHSAAFKRTFNTDMQSDTGIRIMKDIIKEICETYKFNYLHIGGDEVKINNPDFLPEICRFVNQFHVTTIGWSPGGNVLANTIKQLWMKEGAIDKKLRYIDSRHLYLNHMDPLESVVTIFNRQIGDHEKGDNSMLGGEICVWNDRAVSRQDDVLLMNPVYPAMLAFAERSWRGGGEPGWTTIIGALNTAGATEFAEFENRLIDQKKQCFKTLLFPYYKQAAVTWNFYGPYDNHGDPGAKFKPEYIVLNDTAAFTATGGTMILRHWWQPLVKGVVTDAKENTTWYAATRVWSNDNGYKNFWIGFNNLSRSYATDTPAPGTWDGRKSVVWVNGEPVNPPNWKYAGSKGNMETPLIDEGYEYRAPSKVYLKSGWNTILVKVPVTGFKAKDWGNPVKWMFTVLPLDE
ncbi:family 20 glycosylhydrolase [Mucilaginibacter sp. SP1R1]|uniref:family 20 glycosylhydrolase n=1 Tax=Mucilaginibacter sp. SP1R1 TaxID=2723091 RepID=UPI001612A689|nr:family 20 glycosylhydrolase [Mucilaginibacter sp. SP1R1]MBB6152237.1 lysophospholipase L1-like esterase [Mucilaginibacter sp. SP1R1]